MSYLTPAQYDSGQYDAEAATGGYLAPTNQYDGVEQWDTDPASGRTWLIGDEQVRVVGATLTPTTLTLEVRARTAAERQTLDTLDSDAGAVDSRERADGTIRGLDTAGGQNTFTIRPPYQDRPPRIERDWLVDDVVRNRTSADTRATSATLSFIARETRDRQTGHADAADADAWSFALAGATVITPRVTDITQDATTTLLVIATPRQAEAIESITAATAGAVVREVPDGQWFDEDTTPNDRQSVTITPPSGASDPAIPAETYVVESFESVGTNAGVFRITLEISSRYEG